MRFFGFTVLANISRKTCKFHDILSHKYVCMYVYIYMYIVIPKKDRTGTICQANLVGWFYVSIIQQQRRFTVHANNVNTGSGDCMMNVAERVMEWNEREWKGMEGNEYILYIYNILH